MPSRPKDINYPMQQNVPGLASMSPGSHDVSPTQQTRHPSRPMTSATTPDSDYPFGSSAANAGHPFSGPNRSLLDMQRPRVGFPMRPQDLNPSGTSASSMTSQSMESQLESFDLHGISERSSRGFFHTPLISPSPSNHLPGGSGNTSSTSSPAPGSLSSQMQNPTNTSMGGSLPSNFSGELRSLRLLRMCFFLFIFNRGLQTTFRGQIRSAKPLVSDEKILDLRKIRWFG